MKQERNWNIKIQNRSGIATSRIKFLQNFIRRRRKLYRRRYRIYRNESILCFLSKIVQIFFELTKIISKSTSTSFSYLIKEHIDVSKYGKAREYCWTSPLNHTRWNVLNLALRRALRVTKHPWFFVVNEYLHVLWGVSCQEFNKAKPWMACTYIFIGFERSMANDNAPSPFMWVLKRCQLGPPSFATSTIFLANAFFLTPPKYLANSSEGYHRPTLNRE